MGWSFSSISILKNDITQDQIEKHIVQFMRKNGSFLTVGSPGAVLTTGIDRAIRIISRPSSKWITIIVEEMPGKQQDKLSASFSKKFKTYVLSLTNVDSDFMEILLYNQVKSDTAFVGIPYDMEDEYTIARGNPEAWKEIAKDPESLISQFSENHVFSEEILFSLESETGISRKDILQIPHSTEEGQQPSVNVLMHFASGNAIDPYITDAPTILESFGNVLPNMQNETSVSFINRGGVSTGLDIWIVGPSVEKRIISIDEIELICRTDPRKETVDDDNLRKVTGKTCLVNSSYGENAIYAHFPDFVIPEGIKPVTGVNSLKYMSIEFRHLIEVKFIPSGPDTEDIPEISVIAHPLCNNDGCAKTTLLQQEAMPQILT